MAIDDEEVTKARFMLDSIFPKQIGIAVVRANPQSRKTKGYFSPVHEYALFYGKSLDSAPGSLDATEKKKERYPFTDSQGRYAWMNFIRTGSNDKRSDRPKLFYPIVVSEDDTLRIPKMKWSPERSEYELQEQPREGEVIVLPVIEKNGTRIEKNWHRGHLRVSESPAEYRVRRTSEGHVSIDFKTRMDESATPSTWWDAKEYASANYGAAELKELFGSKPFDFPKAQGLVADCLKASGAGEDASLVLDFFAGSGTTGHAVIEMNREDEGHRKYILVDAGRHCLDVIVPRLKKAVYADQWKDGAPSSRNGASHTFKVVHLESYEDALNNLDVKRTSQQGLLLEQNGNLREQYILSYMLDVESRGSQSLLNVESFRNPDQYKLRVERNGETQLVNVDLVETFNWLIGLTVRHIAAPQCFAAEFERDAEKRLQLKGRIKQEDDGPWWFRTVTGTTPDGRKTLVIWRKRPGGETPDGVEQDNLVLDEWFTRQGYSSKDSEHDLIYVNGDNNLENLRRNDQTWKVRLIDEEFARLMFSIANTK